MTLGDVPGLLAWHQVLSVSIRFTIFAKFRRFRPQTGTCISAVKIGAAFALGETCKFTFYSKLQCKVKCKMSRPVYCKFTFAGCGLPLSHACGALPLSSQSQRVAAPPRDGGVPAGLRRAHLLRGACEPQRPGLRQVAESARAHSYYCIQLLACR